MQKKMRMLPVSAACTLAWSKASEKVAMDKWPVSAYTQMKGMAHTHHNEIIPFSRVQVSLLTVSSYPGLEKQEEYNFYSDIHLPGLF